MKYLFINTVSGFGSTGKIVAKTCRELMAQGHECLIAYGRKENKAEDIPSVRIGNRVDNLTHLVKSQLLDGTGFGSYFATKKFLEQVRSYDPDVIWIHNLHGYYIHVGLLFEYLHTCGKEIKWTLHDCWAFTGHCPYFDYVQCDKWKTGCHHCPQKGMYPASLLLDSSRSNYEKKKALFTGIPNVTLITPSHWLASRVKASFLGEYPVEVVYNTVDETVFRPVQSDFAARYGLEGKKILLGVANVWEKRKGLNDFVALSKLLDDRFKIVLIGLPQKLIDSLPPEILGLPRTASAQELAEAYSAAWLYICPSTEETFGMTVLEASLCGTKCVVYQGTACEEVAEPFDGIAVPRGAENIYQAICRYLEETEA